jgi:hypothetical protein
MPLANAPHALLHAMSGSSCALLSPRNKRILSLSGTILAMRNARAALLRRGERIDVDFPLERERAACAWPSLSAGDASRDWIAWPLPPLTDPEEIRALIAREDDLALASFSGVLKPGAATRLVWGAVGWLTASLTLAPLAAGLAQLAAGANAAPWFLAFGAVELLHAAELPLSLRARHGTKAKPGFFPLARTVLLTLVTGFPAWLPYRKGMLPPQD